MKKALVEISTGKVVNVIEYDAKSDWQVPQGCALYDVDEKPVEPGYVLVGDGFVAPLPVVRPSKVFPILDVLDAVLKLRGLQGLSLTERQLATRALEK